MVTSMEEQERAQNLIKYDRIFQGEILIYEGYTLNGKAYGEGITYWDNGQLYQKGIFGIKGLVEGEEYYSSGKIRFRGKYQINRAYGPNYPISGDFYDENGHLIYSGSFNVSKGSVGYPTVRIPETFGPIKLCNLPIPVFMWEDVRKNDQNNIDACAPGKE